MSEPGPTAQEGSPNGSPWIRRVGSPLTDEMLAPFDHLSPTIVQFSCPLTDADYAGLGEFLRDYPRVTLRAYGGPFADLEFLRFFPTVRSFTADCLWASLRSLDGLRHLPEDTRSLSLGKTKARLSLAPLARFSNLRNLFLEGHTKDLDVISQLKELRALTLRSVSLPDLTALAELPHLRALALKLGGARDLAGAADLAQLMYLELWMVRGLADLSAVAAMPRLRYLFLQALANVTQLPDLGQTPSIRGVHLETLKALSDLAPLANSPRLEQLEVWDMRQLQAEHFRCFVGHPALREASISTGSSRKNEAITRLLGLPALSAHVKAQWWRAAQDD